MILTLALTSASPARGGMLLALSSVGMLLPVMLVALLIHKLGRRSVGWIMIFTNGLATVPELLPSGMIPTLEKRAGR